MRFVILNLYPVSVLVFFTNPTFLHAQPRPVSPIHTAFVTDTLIQFQWSPVLNARAYEVAIGWDSAFVLPTVQTFSTTQATIGIHRSALPYMNSELTAFWKVRALTVGNNAGEWSDVWRFTMAKPKTLPPRVINQIRERQLLARLDGFITQDAINLEFPIWRKDKITPGFVFLDPNKSIGLPNQSSPIPPRLLYSVQSDMPIAIPVRVKEAYSAYDSLSPEPQLHYQAGGETEFRCQSAVITLTATNSFGWSAQCLFLVIPVIPIQASEDYVYKGRNGLRIAQTEPLNVGQMPINQSTIASFAIVRNTYISSTMATLRFPATKGVEFARSRYGQWQKSLRIDWQEGEPIPDSVWVRYTPQVIGQNFPVIRCEAITDSCDSYKTFGLLRLEAIGIQPQKYSYKAPYAANEENKPPTTIEFTYSNPVKNEALFRLNLTKPSKVKLTVYTLLGKAVEILSDGELPDGQHTFTWATTSLPSGVYGYRLEVNNEMQAGFINVVH